MKNKSRRIFLRNTSLATTGVLLISPLGATKKYSGIREAIGCAPGSINILTGSIGSVQSGKWSDPSTWGGNVPGANDTPLISAGHTVEVDVDATVSGINVNAGGTLQFDPSTTSELRSSQNIVVQGKLVMRPSSSSVEHKIVFIGIDERRFVGGGHDVLSTDVGLWVMGAGQMDLYGAPKKSWTRTTTSVRAGAKSFAVQDASGWEIGDEIVLVPTDTPGTYAWTWPSTAPTPIDSFGAKFERRKITGKSGNTITVDAAYSFDHNQVSSDSGKTWTPEVANLSRNVKIEGTAKGRTHIFIRSSKPQSIYYIGGQHLGPRKPAGRRAPDLVTGRYGLHFHHCNHGSDGSMVEGCALYDAGNRLYVPHTSHGITMRNNVAFNTLEASFWWDFQELSHYVTWEGNLTAWVAKNGNDSASRGMEMNQGDGNIARNNVVVYGHNGQYDHQGAYVWNADTEGVWVFENNLAHSNRTGIFVWQNTPNTHTIVGYEAYNNECGIFHGAYINSYTYTNCYLFNSLAMVKAASGNSSGVRFEKSTFDGGNVLSHPVEILGSQITNTDFNAFRECTFKSYKTVGIRMNTHRLTANISRKHVALIKCNFTGKMTDYASESIFDSLFHIQPASGNPSIVSRAGTTAAAAFAPYIYGTGKGLKGEYFNGANFQKHAFTRTDSMIMFQEWAYDKKVSPTQVHHRITGDQFSIRWTGKIEAQYSEKYTFKLEGSGGFRLYINNVAIIQSWFDKTKATDFVTSVPVDLVAGQKYDIKLEYMNESGHRRCMFYWECPSLGRSIHVPQSQLYSDGGAAPPPPPPTDNRAPVASAGADITIALPINKAFLDGSASTLPDLVKTYEWSKISGPTQATLANKNAISTEVKDLVEGTYVFRLKITSKTGVVTSDDVSVKVNSDAVALTSNAGADQTITLPTNTVNLDGSASSPKESIKTYEWIKVSGPTQGTIDNKNAVVASAKGLVAGTYVYKLKIVDHKGIFSEDAVQIIVNPQGPAANAGADVSIALPTNSVVLNGSASSAPAGIKSYEWTKVSGPAKFKIVNKNAISPVVKDLQQGTYVFKLKITDRKNGSSTDQVTVTVGNGAAPNNNGNQDKLTKEKPAKFIVKLNMTASPNPSLRSVATVLTLSSNSDLPIKVTIYNPYGRPIATYSNLKNNSTIKWGANAERGTYYAIAEQSDRRKSVKLMKM